MSAFSRFIVHHAVTALIGAALIGCTGAPPPAPETPDTPAETVAADAGPTESESGPHAKPNETPVDGAAAGAAMQAALPEPLRDVAREEPFQRRALPVLEKEPGYFRGISYGPFREGQAPGGPNPTREQITEDLKIISGRWTMIRVYSSADPTETILKVIQDEKLPMQVMVGAWIAPNDMAANAREVEGAIRLAKAYPDVVAAVSVGNESQVDWSGHRTPPEVLLASLRAVRANVDQPVSTADDYNFWNKPHSDDIANEIDFLVLHAYAMWNGKSLDEAVKWTADTVAAIHAEHPELPLVMGETGWATQLNPEGNEKNHIRAPAGETEQARFFNEFTAWADEAKQSYFYFEAFDEPWKGSGNPLEVEKHWGLYNVDRTPKAVLSGGGQ